jgi:transitional endoplasmic reticulum ATPase
MLSRSQGLNSAIEFAKHFQPAVIFAEDIDRASENREEDESVNDLVNTLDGIMTKGCEIMVVLTTNFIERIDQSLLRPGRFDAVIKLELPNQETVQKIIHLYGGELIPTGTKLDRISVLLDKQPPALIREVVDRSKIFMLMEDRKTISSDDLIASTMGMKAHMDLLRPKSETKSEEEILGSTLVSLMKKSIGEVKFQGEGTDSNGEETTIVELRRKA